ncbi:MAG TPA: nitrate- and nitrite sensing domain-containing protein [Actinoplanes sp.]|nr:nitrate- and nitrite sensing domain-containing protein [Actinoplanes sp.]
MSTGSSTLPARRGGFRGLRNMRLRGKIAGLLILPLAAVSGLATMRLLEVARESTDAGRVVRLAELGTELSDLGRLLHEERMAAAEYLTGANRPETRYQEAAAAVDAKIVTVRTDRAAITGIPARVESRLVIIDRQLATLSALRTGVEQRNRTTVTEATASYGGILGSLTDYETLLGLEAARGPVADGLTALGLFAVAESAAADQAALAYVIRATGDSGADRQRELISTQVTRTAALTQFRAVATSAQLALADSVLDDPAVQRADQVSARLSGTRPASQAQVAEAFADLLGLLRTAEGQLGDEVVEAATEEKSAADRMATIELAGVAVIVIVAVALGVYLGRGLLLAVRRLREGALGVANRDLPVAVSLLHDVEGFNEDRIEQYVTQTQDPIQIPDQDELGEVAEAFNMVHREAIRIAAEQAAMRTSMSTMFLSLARRSQTLVDRMIGELDQIERMEEDPKRLARLFELDHLATRMRRNDENLLVLAGSEVGTPRREDALLIDTLRAAQSEVELYHRIEFGTVDTDVFVAAAAVNDVVRLVAELLDNATRFSAPETVVTANGTRIGGPVVIRVEDRGLGITAEHLEHLNRRLYEPSEVDASAFRLMGLAVVARLAARHGIRVELSAGPDGGTTAEVTLPADIVTGPGAEPAGPPAVRAATWTRPGPPPTAPFVAAPSTVPPPIRATPPPARPAYQPPPPVGVPMSELDLVPTPDRPKLPTRVPKPLEPGTPAHPPLATPAMPTANVANVVPEPASAAPIQVEMQQPWFPGATPGGWNGMPTAGYAPPIAGRAAVPVSGVPVSGASVGGIPVSAPPMEAPARSVPKPRPAAEDRWRTRADDGWQLARAAAEPKDGGSTRSGLPKRVPQAQLVPGGVDTTPRAQHRRNPDEVRGLLSAYHRGVQRGRTDGVAETAAAATQAPKENDQ